MQGRAGFLIFLLKKVRLVATLSSTPLFAKPGCEMLCGRPVWREQFRRSGQELALERECSKRVYLLGKGRG
jgi:hypothetical protein